jgi:predicted negative regulator of RcsB-dependent stress response
MAAYDLEEQEQLDELKTWWKLHGNLVTNILLALALAAAGWQGWNWWQRQQSAQASAVFSAMQSAATQRDTKRVRDLAGELVDKYSITDYAGMGALLAARIQVDAGDSRNARVQLAWAAENTPRIRACVTWPGCALRRLMLDDKAYDDALKQLVAEPGAAFVPRGLPSCAAIFSPHRESRQKARCLRNWRLAKAGGAGEGR